MTARTRYAVAGGSALLLGLSSPAVAATAQGEPVVVNREVVFAELDSAGKLDVARLLNQLTVSGTGTVKVADPVSGKNLRNLDGFGTPEVKDGKALYEITVSGGSTKRRTVSDFTKDLPVEVSAAYTLNGKKVEAKDIVGKTGKVTATYTVTNVSGSPTTVTWKDGKGVTHTETVTVPTPYIGTLNTTLPSSYTDLLTPAADAAGDGQGGTVLAYSMVLFEPIGKSVQTFTWSGHVEDGEVPSVSVSIVPASPTTKPQLSTGAEGYKGGAEGATELTEGASLIDSNLLALQRGAGDLLAGLTKLAAGAADLRDGLADELAPGAAKLADGADDAQAGSSELSSGLDQADAGADALAAGLDQILAGVQALPASLQADPDYQSLLGALTGVQAAISTKVVPGIEALKTAALTVKGALQQISASVTDDTTIAGMLTALGADITAGAGVGDITPALAADLGGQVAAIGTALQTQATILVTTLATIANGIGSSSDMSSATMLGGLNLLKLGVDNPACNLADPTNPANPCGIKQVQGLVAAGIGQLVDGISDGLADVLTQANDGAADLADGMSQLAEGGEQIADGLDSAKAGNTKVVDGAGRLRDEGTTMLVEGGNDVASENAKKYATLVALNEKVVDGALPYGAPEGATGSAAYKLVLAAADTTSRDNTNRGLLAVLLLAAATAVSWTVRRRALR